MCVWSCAQTSSLQGALTTSEDASRWQPLCSPATHLECRRMLHCGMQLSHSGQHGAHRQHALHLTRHAGARAGCVK